MPSEFFISADLGQANDYTAITILERPHSYKDVSERPYHLRHIERPERGTPYPHIVERLRELTRRKELLGGSKTVVIDRTGVGAPVWDMMQKAGFDARLKGILITGGANTTEDGDCYHVPKRDLIMALLVSLQNGQLRIAKGLPLADTLIKEMLNFKVRISESGNDRYEAWRESVHDDIVLSASMAVWLASRRIVPNVMVSSYDFTSGPPKNEYPDYVVIP